MSVDVTGGLRINGEPCVAVPLSLFNRMALCFYGGGPGLVKSKNGISPEFTESRVMDVDDDLPMPPPVPPDAPLPVVRIPVAAGIIPRGAAADEWDAVEKLLRGPDHASK